MTLYSRLVTAIIITLLPIISTAQKNSESQVIDQIIEETSIAGQMNQSPEELYTQYSQNPFGLESSINEQMLERYSEAFETGKMLRSFRESFRQEYDAEHANATVNWLNEKNTEKVHDQEKEFYTIQGIRKRVVNRYELEKNPPDKNRIEIIRSLTEETSAVDFKIESYATIFRSVVTAFSRLSNQQSFNDAQIENFVKNYRSQIQSQVEQQVTNQYMIKYYGLENEVLQQYTSFYQTEPGKWLNGTTSESIQSALENAANQFLKSINEIE